MDKDKIINDVLEVMSDRQQHSVQGLVAKLFRHIDTANDFRERMTRKGLVKPYTKDGEMITDFGMEVVEEYYGWLNYLHQQEINRKPKHHWSGIGANYATMIGAFATIVAVGLTFYSLHNSDKINKLEKRVERLTKDSLTLSATKDSLHHLF